MNLSTFVALRNPVLNFINFLSSRATNFSNEYMKKGFRKIACIQRLFSILVLMECSSENLIETYFQNIQRNTDCGLEQKSVNPPYIFSFKVSVHKLYMR